MTTAILNVYVTTEGAPAASLYENKAYVRIEYTREIQDEDIKDNPVDIVQSSKFLIDPTSGKTELEVVDYKINTGVAIIIESSVGIIFYKKLSDQKPAQEAGDSFYSMKYEVVESELNKINTRNEVKDWRLVRSGSYIPLDGLKVEFGDELLLVAPFDESSPAAVELIKLLEDKRAVRVNSDKDLPDLSSFSFVKGDLSFDGEFKFDIYLGDSEKAANITGWLWILSGPQLYLGYVKENAVEQDGKKIIPETSAKVNVLLPYVVSESKPGFPEEANSDNIQTKTGGKIPVDVEESELINNPSMFGDDPGSYCRPFETPNRILGERSLQTVLRLEQPEIGGTSSFVELELPSLNEIVPNQIFHTVPNNNTEKNQPANSREGFLSRFFSSFSSNSTRPVSSNSLEIQNQAIPKWRKIVRRISVGRRVLNEKNPVLWEGDSSVYQATTLGFGHILEWRIQWRSNGYSLGDIAHTLTLAPRQAKRISKISWQRKESAMRRETQGMRDRLDQQTDQSRDYSNAISSSLSEWSKGGSKSSTFGAAGGIGAVIGSAVVGGGASYGTASSTSRMEGGRNIAAQEQQQLKDSIRQHADSIRQFESTVVQEVTQEEEAESITETIRNPNYGHSLTVIYHQILRHLRVDTVLADVQECVFVPFSLKPFNLLRIIRWRDIIGLVLLKEKYKKALEYLEDVQDQFRHSDIPLGPRSMQSINHMTGSIYIRLGIERPEDIPDDAEETQRNALEQAWGVLAGLIPKPLREIRAKTASLSVEQRDRYYQGKIAPTVATRWANKLTLVKNDGNVLTSVDFTLASGYSYNRVVRVDFSYNGKELSRHDLQNIRVVADRALPPHSTANVTHSKIHYFTDHFDRQIHSSSGQDDLLEPATGAVEAVGARLHFPLDSWEQVNQRSEMNKASQELLYHINQHIEYYHKMIWWHMDRDKLSMFLDGYVISKEDGRSIASVVQRDPIAIMGNTLIFRASSGASLRVADLETPKERIRHYGGKVASAPMRVSLPTDGLYAQAIMDKCDALEEHFGDKDWVVNQPDLALDELGAEALASRRNDATGLTPSQLPDSLINLPQTPNMPTPSGLGSILDAVTSSNSFRDMAGLAGTQANALAAMKESASLAKEFGSKAVDVYKTKQATELANKRIDSINKAKKKGLINESQAQKLTNDMLNEQKTESVPTKLTQEPIVENAINKAANRPGTPVEIKRHGQHGEESINIGRQIDVDALSPEQQYEELLENLQENVAKERNVPPHLTYGVSGIFKNKQRISASDDEFIAKAIEEYNNPIVQLAIAELRPLHDFKEDKLLDKFNKLLNDGDYETINNARITLEKIWRTDPWDLPKFPDLFSFLMFEMKDEISAGLVRDSILSGIQKAYLENTKDLLNNALANDKVKPQTVGIVKHIIGISDMAEELDIVNKTAEKIKKLAEGEELNLVTTKLFNKSIKDSAGVITDAYTVGKYLSISILYPMKLAGEIYINYAKQNYVYSYCNYINDFIKGDFPPKKEKYAAHRKSLELVLDSRNREDFEHSSLAAFDAGWREAKNHISDIAKEEGGLELLILSINNLRFEHPDPIERQRFLERKLAYHPNIQLPSKFLVHNDDLDSLIDPWP